MKAFKCYFPSFHFEAISLLLLSTLLSATEIQDAAALAVCENACIVSSSFYFYFFSCKQSCVRQLDPRVVSIQTVRCKISK